MTQDIMHILINIFNTCLLIYIILKKNPTCVITPTYDDGELEITSKIEKKKRAKPKIDK